MTGAAEVRACVNVSSGRVKSGVRHVVQSEEAVSGKSVSREKEEGNHGEEESTYSRNSERAFDSCGDRVRDYARRALGWQLNPLAVKSAHGK